MRRNKKVGEWAAFILGIGLILALIQAGNALQGRRPVFPSADQTVRAFFELLSRKETYAEIGTTLAHAVKAIALSAVIGTVIGLGEGLIPYLHALLRPLHALLRSMPMILLAMVMLMATRFSKEWMPVLTGCMVLVPMISEAGYEGCTRIDRELIDVYRLDSRTSPRIILRVYLPMMSGYMKQAFVNACGTGLKVIVTAEYLVHTMRSLGQAVYLKLDALGYEEVFAYALIMALLVLVLTGIPALIVRIVNRQKKEEVTTG